MDLPETVLQFGAGNFLRAFADLFIHQANEQGQAIGRVVVVQSTGDARANLLNQTGGRYHVVVRGRADGEVVDRVEEAGSISRALFATTQWNDVLDVARSPNLRYILSNTTEAGYALDPADQPTDAPPKSFPAKLLAVLYARFQAGRAGLTILPCELLENNADLLLKLVKQLSDQWKLPDDFWWWVQAECHWLSSLVDRIVPGRPAEHPLLASDPLLLMAEPFAFWALQTKPKASRVLEHPAVTHTTDVLPYFLRKVRILNGAHTALVSKVGVKRFETVREALDDPQTAAWLETLLTEEIVPVLVGRCEEPATFARQTLERFRNPFLRHKLSDIAVHHAAKKEVRLVPTREEYVIKFGRTPPMLDEVVAAPPPA